MTLTETELVEQRELIARAMKLSRAARESLALELFDTLDGPPDDPDTVKSEWQEELSRRLDDIESDKVELADAHASLDRIREELKKVRQQ